MSVRKMKDSSVLVVDITHAEVRFGAKCITHKTREVKLLALLGLIHNKHIASDGLLEVLEISRIEGYRNLQTESLKATIRRFVRELSPALIVSPKGKTMEFYQLDQTLVTEVRFDKSPDEVLAWLELSPRQEVSGFSPLLALAEAFYEAAKFEEATHLLQTILDTSAIDESSFQSLLLLSRIRERQGRLDEAWELLRRAEDSAVCAEGDNQTRLQLQQLRLFRLSGETHEAMRVLTLLQRKALVKEGLFWGQVETLAGLLLLDRNDREPKEALPYFERSVSAFSAIRWWWGVQASYANMGLACFMQAQRKKQNQEWHARARDYFEQSISFSKGTGFNHDSPEVYIYLARCKRFLKDWEGYSDVLEKALSLATQIGSKRSTAEAWLEQAEYYWVHHDALAAQRLWYRVLETVSEDEKQFVLAQIAGRLEGID